MAVTIIQGEERLPSRQLGPGQSAIVQFTPQEGVITVTASAFEVQTGGTGQPDHSPGGGGKLDPNPQDTGDGVGIPPQQQDAEVTAALFPPGASKAETAKKFRIRDLQSDKPPAPLELGVRPEQAGQRWKCVFENTGRTLATISGTVRFVKERREEEEEQPPAEVSVGAHADLPSTFLRPDDSATLRFKPAEGIIEILVFGAEVDLGKPTGKFDPNPEDGGDGIGVSQKQNVRIDVALSAPGSAGVVASGVFRSTEALGGEAPEPVIRHAVSADLAGKEWRCRLTNRGDRNIRGTARATFVGRSLRTDIPLVVLNNGLRQLIAAIGLTVRLDGKRAIIGVSDELKEFAKDALGATLSVPADFSGQFSDVNLFALGVRARTDTGQPLITAHAVFETRGEEIKGFVPFEVPVPVGPILFPVPVPTDVDLGSLAITVDIGLRTVELNGRRRLQPFTNVTVDVSAFAEVLGFIGVNVDGLARGKILEKVREVVDSAAFKNAVSDYLTQGFVQLAQQGHDFQDLLVEPDRFVVLHVDPHPDQPPPPPQPPHVQFPRTKQMGVPPALDKVSRARLAKIDHIVVFMQENRSFDHVLGYLSHPDHGLPRLRQDPNRDVPDGLAGGESNPRTAGGTPVFMRPYATRDVEIFDNVFSHPLAVPFGPHHEHDHVVSQIADGTMRGFADDFISRFPGTDPQFAMSFYTREHLPLFDALAARYAVCDRWFSSHPGPTQPNRFCTLSGHTPVLDNFAVGDPILGYLRMPTIFDILTDAGVDWAYYEGDVGFLRMYDRYRLDGKHVRPFASFFRQAELGLLPPVSFIDPNFTDVPPAATANDDHPPADLRLGQKLIEQVHDALATSPRWVTSDGAGTLLVITYDEHGGFFDHVAPPGTAASDRPGPVAPIHPDGDPFYGPRVPTFVISPFVRPGAVNSTIFDHTSILTTILRRFVGEIPAELGPRVAVANHLAGLLELDEPSRRGRLPAAPAPSVRRRFRDTRKDPRDFHAAMRALAQPRRS